jgi:hypothetical protein
VATAQALPSSLFPSFLLSLTSQLLSALSLSFSFSHQIICEIISPFSVLRRSPERNLISPPAPLLALLNVMRRLDWGAPAGPGSKKHFIASVSEFTGIALDVIDRGREAELRGTINRHGNVGERRLKVSFVCHRRPQCVLDSSNSFSLPQPASSLLGYACNLSSPT